MKSQMCWVIGSLCWFALGACEPNPVVDAGGPVDASAEAEAGCPTNVVCKSPKVWSPTLCACIDDPCPGNVVCQDGAVWDHATCSCVACPDQNVACKSPQHWDKLLCACVD